MTTTNKWLLISESHGDSNRYTFCREKSDQYVTRFPRSVRVWSKTIHISRGQHLATFCEMPIGLDRSHCSLEKRLPTQSTAHRLTDPRVRTQFLSRDNQLSRGCKPGSCRWPATKLTGHISPRCDRYVQYLLVGANPSVLNRRRRGYNLGGDDLSHTTPQPSQPVVSTFHLRAPPSLQFNQVSSTKPRCWMWRTYGRHVVFRPLGHLP
jgi:hypothetical protein